MLPEVFPTSVLCRYTTCSLLELLYLAYRVSYTDLGIWLHEVGPLYPGTVGAVDTRVTRSME